MIMLVLIWMLLDYSVLIFYSVAFSKVVNEKMANLVSRTSGTILFLLAIYAVYTTLYSILKT